MKVANLSPELKRPKDRERLEEKLQLTKDLWDKTKKRSAFDGREQALTLGLGSVLTPLLVLWVFELLFGNEDALYWIGFFGVHIWAVIALLILPAILFVAGSRTKKIELRELEERMRKLESQIRESKP